jgi:hypothetical protein
LDRQAGTPGRDACRHVAICDALFSANQRLSFFGI